MSEEEAIKILEDENQVIYDYTTGKTDEKWKKAYKTVIQIAKNSIPKEKVKNYINCKKRLIKNQTIITMFEKGEEHILNELEELLEGK